MDSTKTKLLQFQADFQELAGILYRYILYRVPQQLDCEDIVSETMFMAYRNIEQYDTTKGTLEQWLKGIAKREIIRYWRKHKITLELDETLLLIKAVDTGVNVEDLDRKLLFNDIMDSLSPDVRSILALHYIDGLTYEEVARAINKQPESVRQFFSRLHRNLQQQFSHRVLSN